MRAGASRSARPVTRGRSGAVSREGAAGAHTVIRLAREPFVMADDKNARDEQAHNRERRQRERELEEARERSDEPEPVQDEPERMLGDLDEALDEHDFPTTTASLVEAHGDREVETRGGWTSLEEVLGPVEDERYDSADDVRRRIQGLIRR